MGRRFTGHTGLCRKPLSWQTSYLAVSRRACGRWNLWYLVAHKLWFRLQGSDCFVCVCVCVCCFVCWWCLPWPAMIQKLLDLTVAKQKVEQLVLKVCFLLGQPANIRSEVSVRDHEESRPLDASAAAESTKWSAAQTEEASLTAEISCSVGGSQLSQRMSWCRV